MNKSMYLFAIASFLISTQMIVAFGGGGVTTVGSESALKGVISGNNFVVVQFRNPKCPHCINFTNSGIFAKLAEMYPQVRFVEINSDEAPSAFINYKINGTPTFIYFRSGKKKHTFEGTSSLGFYKSEIKKFFGISAPKDSKKRPAPQEEEYDNE